MGAEVLYTKSEIDRRRLLKPIIEIYNPEAVEGAAVRFSGTGELTGRSMYQASGAPDVRFQEIKRRYLDGQPPEQMAMELHLSPVVVAKILRKVQIATTLEEYQLPEGVQEDVTLAYLNKILVEGGESADPRAMKVALGAASMIQKHPLVQGKRKATPPNAQIISEIGGGPVDLEGLLAAPEEGQEELPNES